MGRLDNELAKAERRLIREALAAGKKDAKRAAKSLGISVDELAQRARRLAIPLLFVRRRKRRASGARPNGPLQRATHRLEHAWMLEALRHTGGNISAAAALINVNRARFHDRIKKFGIHVVRAASSKPARKRNIPRRDLQAAVRDLRRMHIAVALSHTVDDKTAAAKLLGVDRSTLYRYQKSGLL